MKKLAWVLGTLAAIAIAVFVHDGLKDARQAREASMFGFLCMHLEAYRDTVGDYPETLADGIEQGLLVRFPIDRVDYFHEAYEDGRFQYARDAKVGYTLTLAFGDRALYGDEHASGRWVDLGTLTTGNSGR